MTEVAVTLREGGVLLVIDYGHEAAGALRAAPYGRLAADLP